MTKVACFLILVALVFGQIKSESAVFRFANVFGSHMVLQQAPKRASIWGYGEDGQEVVVIFSGDMYRSFIIEKTEGNDINVVDVLQKVKIISKYFQVIVLIWWHIAA